MSLRKKKNNNKIDQTKPCLNVEIYFGFLHKLGSFTIVYFT